MIANDVWKQILHNDIAGVHLLYDISMMEKKLLDQSIEKNIDEKFMEYDTNTRLKKNLKVIPNFPGYFASQFGRIWSDPKGPYKNGRFLKFSKKKIMDIQE